MSSQASASESHGCNFDPSQIGRNSAFVENAGTRTNKGSERVILEKGVERRSRIGRRRLSREFLKTIRAEIEKKKHLETTEKPHCWWSSSSSPLELKSPGRVKAVRLSKKSPSRLSVKTSKKGQKIKNLVLALKLKERIEERRNKSRNEGLQQWGKTEERGLMAAGGKEERKRKRKRKRREKRESQKDKKEKKSVVVSPICSQNYTACSFDFSPFPLTK